jgi:hypothetical protein
MEFFRRRIWYISTANSIGNIKTIAAYLRQTHDLLNI